MLGTSKQVKWASEIRDSKLAQVEICSQKFSFLSAKQISTIQVILEAQEDAGWWIDNRDVTSHSLILWAANHVRIIPEQHKLTATSIDPVYPLSFLSEINLSTPEQKKSKSWIAVVDNNEEPITSKSEIVNCSIVEEANKREEEPDYYLIHQSRLSKSQNLCPLYRLLQNQNGGWSMKGWSFLTLYRDIDDKFYVEGIVGELIIAVSFVDKLCKLRIEQLTELE